MFSSFKYRLIASFLSIGLALVLFMVIVVPSRSNATAEKVMLDHVTFIVNLLADNLAVGMQTRELDAGAVLQQTLNLLKGELVVSVAVLDPGHRVVKGMAAGSARFTKDTLDNKREILTVFRTLKDTDGKILGFVEINFSKKAFIESINRFRIFIWLASLFALMAMIVVGAVLANYINRRLKSLESATVRVSSGDFDHPVPVVGSDELSNFSRTFNKMVSVLRDTTQQLRASNRQLTANEEKLKIANIKAEAATKAKSEFLANMSHEIRTPMNAIIGFLDILESTPLNEQQRDYLKTVSSSGYILLDIINDILDLSKVESGELKLESIGFNLEHLVEDVVKLIRVRITEKPIDFFYEIGKEVPWGLEGDPTRIRQILINLFGNSIKFTEEGSVSLQVKLEKDLENGIKLIRFSVRDTGIGIPREKVDNLFQPFSQVDSSTTRKFGGTGLGLSICRNYVEKMGGRIWVESELGKGSEFIFTIPLKEKPLEGIAENMQPVPMLDLKGKTVYIVDDNEKSRQIIRYMCERAGMVVSEESRSEKVADLLHESAIGKHLFDLALIDIMMPITDGMTLARKIKSDDLLKDMKIVAISSFAVKGAAAEIQNAGFDAFLPKPIINSELLSVMCTVLGDNRPDGQIITKHLASDLACKGIKVLVAEDNPVNRKLLQVLLKNLECKVHMSENGREAVEELKVNTYDIVLMDNQMPVMGGLEATQVIRAEISKDLPVLGLSASVMKEDREKGLAAGMNDYLTKPINPKKLKESLMKWSGRAS